MNGKKAGSVNPLAQLNASLAGLASSAPSTLRCMRPLNRPLPVADRLSTISHADLIKYIQSTVHLLKNRSLIESLPDGGLKIRSSLVRASEEAEKRGLEVRGKKATGDEALQDSSVLPLHSPLTNNPSSEALPQTEVSPAKKMIKKAAEREPDLEHALRSLSLRHDSRSKAELLQKDTPGVLSTAQKAKCLSLNESLALEKHHEQWRQGILKQRAKEELAQSTSVATASLTNQETLDYRKYQFLRYQEDDSLSDSDHDEEDVIEEEDSQEEDNIGDKEDNSLSSCKNSQHDWAV